MGLYGSFALFALTHHLILMLIEKDHSVSDTYRILGDDVIISDERVAKQYYRMMEHLNVPISHEKCVTSDLLTEFAGKIVTPYGVIPTAKAPAKGRWLSVSGFINYCRVSRGISGLSAVPKQYRDVARAYAALPTSYGGAGVNPLGLSLQFRLSKFYNAIRLTRLPTSRDLRSTLVGFALGGNPWVRQVMTYLNDQLSNRDRAIVDLLAEKFPDLINLPTELSSFVLQVLGDKADELVYMGRIPDESSKDQVIEEWRSVWRASNDDEDIVGHTLGRNY
jgi:hypothetical protein